MVTGLLFIYFIIIYLFIYLFFYFFLGGGGVIGDSFFCSSHTILSF